jgi:hypothetical protein
VNRLQNKGFSQQILVNKVTVEIALIAVDNGKSQFAQNLWKTVSLHKVYNFGAGGGFRFL